MFYWISLVYILKLSNCLAYDPTIIMPYKEIPGSSSDISIIGNTIQCTDARADIKTCAEHCFVKNIQEENCVGFLKDGNPCFLCKVVDRAAVTANQFTTFTGNQKLYLLQNLNINPDVYISMDEFDVSSGTITGKGVSGGSVGITADDLIPGKVGQAIHFGGRIYPAVAQPECFCSFYYCSGKMSLSFWTKSYSTGYQEVITPQSGNPGLTVTFTSTAGGRFRTTGMNINSYATTSSLSSTEWSFVTYVANVVDLQNGNVSTYVNALKEGFSDAPTSNTITDALSCSTVVIGAKNVGGHYSMNGDLDEVKYFYRVLSDAGIDCAFKTEKPRFVHR